MRGDADLPFICPSCSEKFGYGDAAILLTFGGESSFDENLPCCGIHVKGIAFLDEEKYMQIREMEIVGE